MEELSQGTMEEIIIPVRHLEKKKNKKIKWLVAIFLVVFLFLVGGLLFLKLNLAAAAVFTDNVLRPLIGDQNVIKLEGIFFNTSDQFQHLTDKFQAQSPPQFETPSVANIKGGKLNLNSINLNAGAFQMLSDEGIWHDYPLKLFPDKEVMAYTFVRPDPTRPYAKVTLVQMDMSVMQMGSVAGTQQPGGPVGRPGPGVVPKNIIDSGNLISAFDGGFQYKDGAYGMIVGNTTYLPLEKDLGTLVGYNDGSLKIVEYSGQSFGSDVAFIRQNCPMLIKDGNITVTDPANRKLWGRLAAGTVGIYTWRSGVGLTATGNLVFAVGNNLTPDTLAIALKSAGAVNAIQLDINPIWVRFNIFQPSASGKYTSTTLTKDLTDGSKGYLNGYAKDFFYIYKK